MTDYDFAKGMADAEFAFIEAERTVIKLRTLCRDINDCRLVEGDCERCKRRCEDCDFEGRMRELGVPK